MKKFTLVSFLLAAVCWIISAATLISFGEKGFQDLSQDIVGRKLIEFQTKSDDLPKELVQNLEELEITVSSSTLDLSTSDDEGLHVEYPGSDKGPIQGKIDGKKIKYDFSRYFEGTENKLVVRLFNGNGFININDKYDSRVRIKVPKNFKILKVKSDSGDAKFSSLNGASLRFETTSGDLRVRKSNFSKIDVNSISGDIRFQGYAQSAELKTTSGDVRFQSENKSPIVNVTSTSGDIMVEFPELPDTKVSVETISGEVSLDVDGPVDELKKPKGYKLGNGTGELKLKTVSGGIGVHSLRDVF